MEGKKGGEEGGREEGRGRWGVNIRWVWLLDVMFVDVVVFVTC